jgi:hypothetical protein
MTFSKVNTFHRRTNAAVTKIQLLLIHVTEKPFFGLSSDDIALGSAYFFFCGLVLSKLFRKLIKPDF